MHKHRILIVDDEASVLETARRTLANSGYHCDCASDVETATRLLASADYDLLISDIHLPGNQRLEFIRGLRDAGRSIPVILITGFPEIQTAIDSIQLGVVAYLLKPFGTEELRDQARRALKRASVRYLLGEQRERLGDWIQALSTIDQAWKEPGANPAMTIHEFIDLTANHIMGLVGDLKRLTEASMSEQAASETCQLFRCPRGDLFYRTLMETIDVLEKTKGSFHSKELAALRKKLEHILRNPPGQPALNAEPQ